MRGLFRWRPGHRLPRKHELQAHEPLFWRLSRPDLRSVVEIQVNHTLRFFDSYGWILITCSKGARG